MPREDFKFCRIFTEFFVFVIDSPVYSSLGNRTPGCQDSPEYSSLGSWDSPVINLPRSWPKLVCKKTCWCQYSRESRLQRYTVESWLHAVLGTRNFFCKLVLMLVPKRPGSQESGVFTHHRGVETSWCIHHWGVKTSRCIHLQGLFWTPGSHFTNFWEHTTTLHG
jgi:hypothetical protein